MHCSCLSLIYTNKTGGIIMIKKILITIFTLGMVSSLSAQTTIHPKIGITENGKIDIINEDSLSNISAGKIPEGRSKWYLIIDEGSKKLKKISFSALNPDRPSDGKNLETITNNDSALIFGYDPIKKMYLLSMKYIFSKAKDGDIIKLDFEFDDNSKIIKFFKLKRFGQPYYTGYSLPCIWFPVGLFGTNFHRGDEGIVLAPMPIGIAAGYQFGITPDFYLGVSVFGSWMMNESINKDNDANTDNKRSYTVKSLSLGALFDVNDYFYVGYSYGFDFQKSHKNPGSVIVLGASTKVIDWLKSSSM